MYGELIKRAREAKGWTPAELAQHMQFPRQRIYEIERSEHLSTKTLNLVADAMGTSVEDIITKKVVA